MIHCLLSPLRDRLHSFFAGDLYPDHDSLASDELAELRDEVVNLTAEVATLRTALAAALSREQSVRATLTQRNTDLRAVIAERDRVVIDLRDVLDLRGSSHPSRLIERDDK